MALCALTLLDGVSDEVTVAGGVVLLSLALVLAWLSTHVVERGDHILGTILTVGAHASLIGLGGHDAYIGGPPGADTTEPQAPDPVQEDKPEDEDLGQEGAVEAAGEGAALEASVDQLLNIQGLRKRAGAISGDPALQPEGEEDVEREEDSPAGRISGPDITVRLKFLNDTEELAVLKPQDTISLLKSKYFSGQEQQIKLIFQGQLLQDPKRTLLSLNITHNSVIHCHVSQAQQESGSEGGARTAVEPVGPGVGQRAGGMGLALSTGSLVVPVFVVMLAVVWYFRINYRQFFTAPATVSLVGVTIFFSFLIFGMYSR
ncbi:transmembrane and ubiquitin-like domain-containing protein 2 [Paramormyrops kingsleyae]|uniref:Transmembrane and ubiquitin-like domain containing 2 n=1 Tax=Paramormyrops kingsleyae TaxID=1676925 RepID=A0A3B3T6P4_9TELE|nr:transmembrane and ubiquitin-like domain-containing protein 2 [Paramormyrops kingsleyae]XP_023684946.1 transmembrane and ubiquitin-like domain-containing protein 2 [Paramormyrops kingsleyae]